MNKLRIATHVREQFEQKKVDKEELKLLYLAYSPIEDIDTFLEEAQKLFPKLNCGLATVLLKKHFPEGEIMQGKYGDNNHTFLLLDGIVIDITADQYGGPKVYVGPLKESWTLRSAPVSP